MQLEQLIHAAQYPAGEYGNNVPYSLLRHEQSEYSPKGMPILNCLLLRARQE